MKHSKTRFPVLITCLLVLLAPAWVFALNLGDIHLKSGPGEPLEAEIPLSGVSAEEQDSLSVGLADVAGFRWAGIEWSPALNRLQFELRRGADGEDYIRIHSDEALRTPVLHFLLKAAWSRGRLFREYTLELDAAPYDSGAAPAPAAGAVEDDWEAMRAAVRASRRYQVVRNDTLWEIARELRPDRSVSIQQMMLALLRTNPDAFSYDNINWLRAGADLWMPSDFEMQALSAAEAFARVLAQNNVWREARGLPAVETGWLASAGTVSAEGELRLVAVGEGDLEDDIVAATEADAASRELALANELVEELALEKVELEDELFEAETIIEDLRRLVELKDDELAVLQAEAMAEQAEPGADLSERVGAVFDSAAEALSGSKLQSMYESVVSALKEYWQVALAFLVLLLALAAWWLRGKFAQGPKGLSVPAASVRRDFVKVTRDEETASSDEEDLSDATEGEEDLSDATEGEEDLSDATEGEEDLTDATEGEEDTVQNKLDLARAYLELGDTDNVRSILEEVMSEGNAAQREEARQLLEQSESG